jgi:hypothetical protein
MFMEEYLRADPEAQPFKDSYEETMVCQGKRKRLEWQSPEHANLSEEEFFAKRREMVNDPLIQDTVKNLRKICGDKVANQYFMKYLDNLGKIETRKGHYEVR